MALESATYIDDLVSSNPGGSDNALQGDDHIRLIKAALKASLPNASKAFRFPDSKASQTADYSISESDDFNKLIPFDVSGGAATANLPNTAIDGWFCYLLKTDGSATAVTVDPAGSVLINGASTITLTKAWQVMEVRWNNSAGYWIARSTVSSVPYYSGGQDIPFSDIAPSANAKRILGAATATDFSEQTVAAVLEWIGTCVRGDILLRGASAFDRKALGASGTVLVSDGTDLVYGSPPIPAFAVGSYATYTALSTAIPADDTIPQVGEGTEIISTAITPIKTSSIIRATFSGFGVADANAYLTAALFKDGAANAVQVATERVETLGGVQNLKLDYSFSPGSLSAITFSVRVGANSGSVAMNGANVARLFGGAASCKLMLQEIFTA